MGGCVEIYRMVNRLHTTKSNWLKHNFINQFIKMYAILSNKQSIYSENWHKKKKQIITKKSQRKEVKIAPAQYEGM